MNEQNVETPVGWKGTAKEIAVILTVVFIIRTFGFGLYQVPTGSMETTMLVGERFFADKLSYNFVKPQRGEIISFNDATFPYSDNAMIRLYQEYVGGAPFPLTGLVHTYKSVIGWPLSNVSDRAIDGPINWTKRVIGIPGDHIKGTIEDGKPVVYRNGEKIDEPYINPYPLIQVYANGDRSEVKSKSYNPDQMNIAKSFYNDAFYRIEYDEVYRLPAGYTFSGVNVTEKGFVLKEPGKPIAHNPCKGLSSFGHNRMWDGKDEYDVVLGDDEYWCMGDNRRGSFDCRFFGPVKERLIHGRILYRIWSHDSDASWWIVDLLQHPIDFWKRMRWGRFFQRVI